MLLITIIPEAKEYRKFEQGGSLWINGYYGCFYEEKKK